MEVNNMALYTEKVMDHFMNPRNVGEIENADGIAAKGFFTRNTVKNRVGR